MSVEQRPPRGSFRKQVLYFVITLAVVILIVFIIGQPFGYFLGQSVSGLLHLPH